MTTPTTEPKPQPPQPPNLKSDAEIDALPIELAQKEFLKLANRVVSSEYRLSRVEFYLAHELGEELKVYLTPTISGIGDRLKTIETHLSQPGGRQGGPQGLLEHIFDLVGKGFDAYTKSKTGGAVGGVSELDRIVLSNAKALQIGWQKKMIKDFSEWSKIPISVEGETVHHVAPP